MAQKLLKPTMTFFVWTIYWFVTGLALVSAVPCGLLKHAVKCAVGKSRLEALLCECRFSVMAERCPRRLLRENAARRICFQLIAPCPFQFRCHNAAGLNLTNPTYFFHVWSISGWPSCLSNHRFREMQRLPWRRKGATVQKERRLVWVV